MGPPQISDGTLTDDTLTMAGTPALSFGSVQLQSAPQMSPAPHEMDPIQISMQDIHDAIHVLDPNSAAGPDGAHPNILQDCLESLAYPLFKIFSLYLAEAYLPLEWKTSIAIPILEKGSCYSPLN